MNDQDDDNRGARETPELHQQIEQLSDSVRQLATLFAEQLQQQRTASEQPPALVLPSGTPVPRSIPIYAPPPFSSIPPSDFEQVRNETHRQSESLRRILRDQRDARKYREKEAEARAEERTRQERAAFWLKVVAITAGPIGGIVSAVIGHFLK